MTLGTLRQGVVEVGKGWQDHAELGDEGLPQKGIGGDPPLIGGEWGGPREGLEAWVDDVTVAHVMGTEAARQGGAARALGGFAGGPGGEEITEPQGVFVLNPLQDLRAVVFQGTREAIGEAPFGAAHPATLVDALRKGTPCRALGGQGRQLVTLREQECKVQCGGRGRVFGVAERAGCSVRGQGPRVEGTPAQDVVCA
jgi:hypothetical protein